MIKLVRAWLARLTRRPDINEWAMIVALAVATRADCTRRKVGAVVIDTRDRIAGAGYNGSWPGGLSCLGGQCPRGLHYEVPPRRDRGFMTASLCGTCDLAWPCPGAVLPGGQYETGPGACINVHAEINAQLDVSDRNRLQGAALFITAKPCDGCLKITRNSGIKNIVYLDDEGNVQYWTHPFL